MLLPLPPNNTIGTDRPFYGCEDKWERVYSQRGAHIADTLTRKLTIDYDPVAWRIYLPSRHDGLPEAPWLVWTKASCVQSTDNPRLGIITLFYEPAVANPDTNTPGDPNHELPANYTEESTTAVKVDIQLFQNWAVNNPVWGNKSMAFFWDFDLKRFKDSAPAELKGVPDFYDGSFSVTAHVFSRNKIAVAPYVRRRAKPPGTEYAGTAAYNWVILSGASNPQSGFWHTTLVYQYSANASQNLVEWLYPAVGA